MIPIHKYYNEINGGKLSSKKDSTKKDETKKDAPKKEAPKKEVNLIKDLEAFYNDRKKAYDKIIKEREQYIKDSEVLHKKNSEKLEALMMNMIGSGVDEVIDSIPVIGSIKKAITKDIQGGMAEKCFWYISRLLFLLIKYKSQNKDTDFTAYVDLINHLINSANDKTGGEFSSMTGLKSIDKKVFEVDRAKWNELNRKLDQKTIEAHPVPQGAIIKGGIIGDLMDRLKDKNYNYPLKYPTIEIMPNYKNMDEVLKKGIPWNKDFNDDYNTFIKTIDTKFTTLTDAFKQGTALFKEVIALI